MASWTCTGNGSPHDRFAMSLHKPAVSGNQIPGLASGKSTIGQTIPPEGSHAYEIRVTNRVAHGRPFVGDIRRTAAKNKKVSLTKPRPEAT